jgi:DNA repair protein RecN (Recombination protein N)
MLAAVRIENLAIVESLEVRFERGLNVLAGETGAGKSILVDALALLLGGRADPASIRTGCEEAVVEGIFQGPGLGERLEALGLPVQGDEILIRRTVARGGRGRVHVNGALATVSTLQALAPNLAAIVSQHEHVSLLRREKHRELLDAFGGLEAEVAAYRVAYRELVQALGERERLRLDDAERARRQDYLAFQLREFDGVDPEPGEDERLAGERRILAGAEKLRALASEAEGTLYSGEGAVVERLGGALRRLAEAAAVDERLLPVRNLVDGARAEIEEAGRALGRYLGEVGGDPERLAGLDERLEAIRGLVRKHGGTLEAALIRREEMRQELATLTRLDDRLAELDAAVEEKGRKALGLARTLGARRAEAAERFGRAVTGELGRLAMGRAVLSVALSPLEPPGAGGEAEGRAARGGAGPSREGPIRVDGVVLGPHGAEDAEFLFRPNPGEEARPLARTASGGELSRVLLALKRALAAADPVGTYVFDEVDAGIGGATALVVGRMLAEVAGERQVLCVTHLPQVAAHAGVQFWVEKKVQGGRTVVQVARLDDEEARRRALARMLAGSEEAPAALAAAGELRGEVLRALSAAPTATGGKPGEEAARPARERRPRARRRAA